MKDLENFLKWENISNFLKINLLKIIAVFLIFKISGILRKYVDKAIKSVLEKTNTDKSVASFLRSGFSVFYYIILGYFLIEFLGINLSSVMTFLGAAGIVLGLAFKETLGNMCGGLIILTFKPFKVGDMIEYQQYVGEVKSIELFYTRIKTPQNEQVIIPNGIITNTEVRNMTKEKVRRLELNVGVSYKCDILKVKEILKRIVENETNTEERLVLKIPAYTVGVGELSDSSVIFYVYVYVKSENFFKLKLKLNEIIKTEFDKNNIEIPYPQMDVHISRKGEGNGNKTVY